MNAPTKNALPYIVLSHAAGLPATHQCWKDAVEGIVSFIKEAEVPIGSCITIKWDYYPHPGEDETIN